jgi:hypothetical protein
MLVRYICLLFSLEGFRALAILYRIGLSAVNAFLLSMQLGAASVFLGVRCSCTVAAPAFILTEPADVAKLVAVKAPADSEVSGVRFTVIDLGLPDKPTFT